MRANHFRRSLVLTGVAIALSGCQWIPGSDAYRIRLAHAQVGKALIDPYSAKYSEEVVNRASGAVCGLVNAKNPYGAYSGNQPYIASTKSAMLSRGVPEFEQLADAGISAREYGGAFWQTERDLRSRVNQSCAFVTRWKKVCGDHPKNFEMVVSACEIWRKQLSLAY